MAWGTDKTPVVTCGPGLALAGPIDPNLHRNRLHAGADVGGRYSVLSILGEGGMGQVALVRQQLTNKLGAMKLLTVVAPELVERFHREASAPSRLNHPAFPAVFDFGQYGGLPYIVMEFVDGETISGAMHRGHRFSLAEIVAIGRQVCDAMTVAHEAGLIHRDLKAENLMLVARPGAPARVHVLDLGIAKLADAPASVKTRTGMMLGTPMTMSPEQAQGKVIDSRSDIYSLGCVLFYMATGRYPFDEGEGIQIAMQHILEMPPLARERAPWLPPAFAQLLARTLEKAPQARPQSMAELDAALAMFAGSAAAPRGHAGPLVTRVTPEARTPEPRPVVRATTPEVMPPQTLGSLSQSNGEVDVRPPSGRSRLGLWLGAALGIAVAGGATLWLASPAPPPPPLPARVAAPAPPAHTRVRVSVRPAAAHVLEDGRDLGNPALLEGAPGDVSTVEVSAAGYQPQTVEVTFEESDVARIVELVPKPALPVRHHRSRSRPAPSERDLPDSL